MVQTNTGSRASRTAQLLGLLALLLYVCTLAPGIVYGDSAKFHMHIHDGYLGIGVNDHPLYLSIGRAFTHLPFGTIPWRINLVSAVFAAGTVALVAAIVHLLTASVMGAAVAACALAVSHTFWFHAVTPEVYTLHVFTVALQLYSLLLWRRGGQLRYLCLFALTFGLGFDHLMNVLNVPAYAFLILRTDWKILTRRKDFAAALGCFTAGLAFYGIVFLISLSRGSFTEVLLEASAVTHTQHMFSYPLPRLLHFAANALKYLAFQFPFFGFFVGLWGLVTLRKRLDVGVTLLLMYLANVIFVINYNETTDVYALYLPSYVIFAVWLGHGLAHIETRLATTRARSRVLAAVAGVALVALPVATYYAMPRLLPGGRAAPTGARDLPLRDSNTYYLWPPKHHCTAPMEYGRRVCDLAGTNALIVADNGSLARLVLYQQRVHGQRPDIDVARIEPERILETIAAGVPVRPTYIFTEEEDMYPVARLREMYRLVPRGNGLIVEVLAPAEDVPHTP